MGLVLRNVLFTLVVPGTGAVYAPWLILTRGGGVPRPVVWPAITLVLGGLVLYAACQWVFASVGRGTPGPWDAPRKFVAAGPYRWVRNPIYIAALLAVFGEAWLFLSLPLLVYAVLLAIGFHYFWSCMKSRPSAAASARSTTSTEAECRGGFRTHLCR